jgi:putative hydrolase of the HAD superfamily
MRKPKMILFDYGGTIICEPGFSTLNAKAAALRYAVKNPRNLTPEQIDRFADELYEKYTKPVRAAGGEITLASFLRLLFEYLQIEFSVPYEELEIIYHDGISPSKNTPNIEAALNYLRENDIRSAVLSNNSFSGKALTTRINRLLPDNDFEFIISSSDYLIRKPDKMIFELALRKADLPPEDVWFCGDSVYSDANGSHSAGIFPVWYEDLTNAAQFSEEILIRERSENEHPEFEHLHIHDWLELVAVLEDLS